MQGAGNDFVFLNNSEKQINVTPEMAQKLCDRRFGIGGDQLLVLLPSEECDFRMDIYNADGSKVEMCGNGIRCFAKYVYDFELMVNTKISVETLAGVIKPEVLPGHPNNSDDTLHVKVDMGKPTLEGADIPVNAEGLILDYDLTVKPPGGAAEKSLKMTCVSMGNPHAVSFMEQLEAFPVEAFGPEIETHPFFPNRVNAEFVEVLDSKNIKMRVWERGAGETLACGTGACAAAVASILNNKTDRNVTVHLKGGKLEIFWDEYDDHVYMTGPATTVFEGEIDF